MKFKVVYLHIKSHLYYIYTKMKNIIVKETAKVNAKGSEVLKAITSVKNLNDKSNVTGKATPNLFYKIMKHAIIIF